MNILYIGSSGPLSYLPLQALLQSPFANNIISIAVDEVAATKLTAVNKRAATLESLAFYNNIPLLKLKKNTANNIAAISKLKADIILVSCYARKLPIEIISLAKTGCFNIHPSLLPKYRGPTPLFWQFREAENIFGITLHRMTEKFDDGAIVAQQSINMPQGISKQEASILLAKIASKLVLNTLPILLQKKIKELKQNETEASYQSFPQKKDYNVSISWTAQRIYNFICANKRLGIIFSCDIDKKKYKLIDALSYQKSAYAGLNDGLYFIHQDVISFKCSEGYVQCVFERSV